MPRFDQEIVSGSIFRSIWKLAWPVIITQLVAGVHGIVDHILVGQYVGFEGQAGIGASWQLFLVVVVFLSSLFHGMSIFVAQYAGRQDHEAVNRIAYQVLLTSLYLLLFVLAPVGYFLAPSLLDLVSVPPEVRVHALPYLRILFTSSFPLFLMFLVNGAMQSSGNPKIPMILGLGTTAVNVAVSYALITGAGPFPAMGAVGAAIGTAVGPVPGVLVAFWLIARHKVIVGPPERFTLKPDFALIRRVARIGIPSGIQAVLLNIGGAVLIYFINQLPTNAEALAAYTVCYTQLFSVITWTAFGLRAACATVMGQNIGAGKPARGKRAVYLGAGIGFVWALFFGVFYWTVPDVLLSWFGLAGEVLVSEIATNLLKFLTFSGVLVAVTLAFTGGLQGAGDTKKPMYIAFITQIVILLGICFVFLQLDMLSYTVIWAAILIAHTCRLALTYVMFLRGDWEHIKVDLDAERPVPPGAAPVIPTERGDQRDAVEGA